MISLTYCIRTPADGAWDTLQHESYVYSSLRTTTLGEETVPIQKLSDNVLLTKCDFHQVPKHWESLLLLYTLTFVTSLCVQQITSSFGQGADSTLPLLYLSHSLILFIF